jgi:hypothetical protein
MGKTVLVSEETLRDLLEAHASLSAWYYELTSALRSAHAAIRTPDDAARAAFLERIATDFPELAEIAKTIQVPRPYVPPPPRLAARIEPARDEVSTMIEPAARRRQEALPSVPAVPPPPFGDREPSD